MQQKYLKTSETLSFACAGFGRSMIYTLMSTFLLIFYTDAAKLDPVHAGTIILAARIFDAANDPIMGIIVDKTKSKFGKLRPYLLFSPPLILIATAALFYVPNCGYGGRLAYATVSYLMWGICFTIQDVPFWGMSAVVSPLESERTKFISTARIFCTVGGILPKERVEQPKEKVTAGEIVSAFVKNKPLLLLILASVLGSTMLMAQTSGSYIATYLIKDSGAVPKDIVQTAMTVAIGVGMLAAMLLMPVLRKHFSLKAIYIGSAVFGAAVHGILYLVGYGNFYLLLALLVVIGLPLGIFNVITYAMVADSVDYLEFKTGRRSEGVCFASQTFISKLTAGISTYITGFVLKYVGFVQPVNDVPVLDQPEKVFNGMFVMITIIPMIGLALAAVPMIFNDYTGKKKQEIQKALEERREKEHG